MSDDTTQKAEISIPVGMPQLASKEYRIIYSDTFTVKASPVDFGITFGTQTTSPVQREGQFGEINIIAKEITVMMSLASLKTLTQHLASAVEIIESEIGKIRTTKASILNDDQKNVIRNNMKSNPLED
jgi:hypothetical protein